MEPIFIGTDQSLITSFLPTIVIILGFWFTWKKIDKEFRNQRSLLKTKSKLEREEKLRDRQYDYFKEFTDVTVDYASESDKKQKEKNMYKIFILGVKSLHLFKDEKISENLFSAFNKYNEGKISKREDLPDENSVQEFDAGEFIGFALADLVKALKSEG